MSAKRPVETDLRKRVAPIGAMLSHLQPPWHAKSASLGRKKQ